jgi:hypothetical protein
MNVHIQLDLNITVDLDTLPPIVTQLASILSFVSRFVK